MSGGDLRLLGRWGESKVAEWLRKNGYKVIGAGYRCRFGEIDLIATKGKFVCFTEVKMRRNAEFALAREFVDRHKQERLRTTAQHYLCEHSLELQPRFDVAEVYAPQGISTKDPQINYIENAF